MRFLFCFRGGNIFWKRNWLSLLVFKSSATCPRLWHLLQETQGQLHLLFRQRSVKVTRSSRSPGKIDMKREQRWRKRRFALLLLLTFLLHRFLVGGLFRSSDIMISRKRCGVFHNRFLGGMLGIQQFRWVVFYLFIQTSRFHTNSWRRFCPHTQTFSPGQPDKSMFSQERKQWSYQIRHHRHSITALSYSPLKK